MCVLKIEKENLGKTNINKDKKLLQIREVSILTGFETN